MENVAAAGSNQSNISRLYRIKSINKILNIDSKLDNSLYHNNHSSSNQSFKTQIHKFKTTQKHLHKQDILLITIATKKSNNFKLQILQNMT